VCEDATSLDVGDEEDVAVAVGSRSGPVFVGVLSDTVRLLRLNIVGDIVRLLRPNAIGDTVRLLRPNAIGDIVRLLRPNAVGEPRRLDVREVAVEQIRLRD
jgi:ribosomal protein L30/L7E